MKAFMKAVQVHKDINKSNNDPIVLVKPSVTILSISVSDDYDIDFIILFVIRVAAIQQVIGQLSDAINGYTTVLELEKSYIPALKG